MWTKINIGYHAIIRFFGLWKYGPSTHLLYDIYIRIEWNMHEIGNKVTKSHDRVTIF